MPQHRQHITSALSVTRSPKNPLPPSSAVPSTSNPGSSSTTTTTTSPPSLTSDHSLSSAHHAGLRTPYSPGLPPDDEPHQARSYDSAHHSLDPRNDSDFEMRDFGAPDAAAQEPLIRQSRDLPSPTDYEYDESTDVASDPYNDDDVDESQIAAPGAFIWALTFAAGVSGLLFGYDTGVISSTLVSIGTDLSNRPLTTLDKSLVTSATSLFALLASPVTGVLADAWGRKRVILVADVLFVVGALGQAWSSTVRGMIVGRSIVGLAVGSASFVVPLYISELSPSPFRGRLVTVSSLFITGGQVVAYIIGWLFSTMPHGWKWIVGLGALPAALQFFTLGFMPETPRWLVKANRKDRARRVLKKVYGVEADAKDKLVEALLRRVEREVLEEEEAANARRHPDTPKGGLRGKIAALTDGLNELVGVGAHRRALIIACMLQGYQQLCGFNSLMYFSASIFLLVGFRSPTLTSLSIALTNFAFTLVAFHSIDRVGRRRILLLSIPIMVLGLGLCSVAFNFLDLPDQEANGASAVMARAAQEAQQGGGFWALVILLAMVVYVAGYAVGMGNVPWQQSELFPLSVRSLGSATATATNWGSNFLIGLTFLPMMETLTPVGTFALYTLVCAACWWTVYRIYPETAGLGLEDVGGLLRNGWGVDESLRRWAERKRAMRSNLA
ncbi:putative mfs myo-inositol protein [Botryosphaeria dothidea]|uniref:Mfs myo-inositol protein n=1 Tax=Botryosphaeria dothidea TaxID=55169 RepID=A0A8H4J6Q5_9PEZI|nr:putative mfs myo-inositol protein [Botryosphaeria dothidea]